MRSLVLATLWSNIFSGIKSCKSNNQKNCSVVTSFSYTSMIKRKTLKTTFYNTLHKGIFYLLEILDVTTP